MAVTIDEIREDLSKKLEKNRYIHVLGVVEAGLRLNQYYKLGLDEEQVELTMLLHDCAKGLEEEYFEKYKDKYKLNREEIFEFPALAHAYLGAIVAKDLYGIDDPEILEAIRIHTCGKEAMNDLEKILLLADFIEVNRTYENAEKVRQSLDLGLDKCVLMTFDMTIKHLIDVNAIIDLETLRARNYLQRRIDE